MPASESKDEQPVFEYCTLRLLVGIVTFALPVVVLIFSAFTPLSSISVAYHSAARDILVGSLFMIGTLLIAYRGYDPIENRIANLGAGAAIVAALCPTYCDRCPIDTMAVILRRANRLPCAPKAALLARRLLPVSMVGSRQFAASLHRTQGKTPTLGRLLSGRKGLNLFGRYHNVATSYL